MEKNKVMMIIIIVLLLVLLGIVVGGGIFAIKIMTSPVTAEETTEDVEALTQEQIKLITLEDSIYTNLLVGTDGKEHIIKLSVSLGIDISDEKESTEFMTMLNDKNVIVKDVIIGVLRNKTYEELKKTDAQEILRDEIMKKLQQEFNSNLIVKVYISDLFLQ